jgi:hypothetical protein
MIDISRILDLQKHSIIDWHQQLKLKYHTMPWNFIEINNHYNFLLWHEEDIARIKDISPDRMVEAKRNIDSYNQLRNNAMENIDEWVLANLMYMNISSGGRLHSETPGMMIDRLSIMQLKRYHMQEEVDRLDAEPAHREKCAGRVAVLDEQIADLSECLQEILGNIESGKQKFKVYRQLKMYNDPSLNPELYSRVAKL